MLTCFNWNFKLNFNLSALRVAACLGMMTSLLAAPALVSAAPPPQRITLSGHIPAHAIAHAKRIGRVAATEPITLAITLPLRDQQGLQELLSRLYDPTDELYGQYLTPAEFAARFCPGEADYQAVADYARAQGLTITGTHPNRLILDVTGPAHAVEQAFGVKLLRYQDAQGQIFHAPDAEPQVPAHLAGRVTGVVGLENAEHWRTHACQQSNARFFTPEQLALLAPFTIGSGPNGGMAPGDIKTAYNLNSVTSPGSGQTLGLFELDGFKSADISTYETRFGINPKPTITTVKVDGFSGSAGSGAIEVELDIELMVGLANYATILVYEGPNTNTGVVDTYNKIATDNRAKSISTSWGAPELSAGSTILNAENSAFLQMAMQGQSIFAAAGDSGADDNGSSLSVDDPASQPYVVGTGGTTLATNGAGGAYKSETVWNGGSASNGAGGGGISAIWTIPAWQKPVISPASLGSTTMRNVPDISLNADPNTGYAIYCVDFYQLSFGWNVVGGTSAAAPLWASFTALVNQGRTAAHKPLLGFLNPALYTIAQSAYYSSTFHDVVTGNNLFYPAVTGYDLATGWGSFNGTNLGTALYYY